MNAYQTIVDNLTALASLIAILTVLFSWRQSARLPLLIEKLIIHQKDVSTTYFLVIKNRKPYPVEIKSIGCYNKPKYKVEKKAGQPPEFLSLLSSSDLRFHSNEVFEIGANGHTDIRISDGAADSFPEKLLFSIDTSHGYHQIWCKSILVVPMKLERSARAQKIESTYSYQNKMGAKIRYYWLKLTCLLKQAK